MPMPMQRPALKTYALESLKYRNPQFGLDDASAQYCHLYVCRYQALRPFLQTQVGLNWRTTADSNERSGVLKVLPDLAAVNLGEAVVVGDLAPDHGSRILASPWRDGYEPSQPAEASSSSSSSSGAAACAASPMEVDGGASVKATADLDETPASKSKKARGKKKSSVAGCVVFGTLLKYQDKRPSVFVKGKRRDGLEVATDRKEDYVDAGKDSFVS